MNGRVKSTRVALLTPPGRGAIATIVVDGPQAILLVDIEFRSPSGRSLAQRAIDEIAYGKWTSTGEGVVVARRGLPRIEIHCHGGDAASHAVLASLIAAGCEEVTWQQFVAEEEKSPIRAAAHVALADAATERTAAILLDQYQGALESLFGRVIDDLERSAGADAIRRLRALDKWSDVGMHLTNPWRVAIGGPPNVGKSTLINALLGYERAIAFDQPGTTRDVVTAMTAIDGWPVELSDTAGLRTSDEPLEQAGVDRARAELRGADLILLVLDLSQPWTSEAQQLCEEQRASIAVHNKADLLPAFSSELERAAEQALVSRPRGTVVSAKTGWNIPALLGAIGKRLVPIVPSAGAPVPFRVEQVVAIRAAIHQAESGNLTQAAATLRSLVGSGGS